MIDLIEVKFLNIGRERSSREYLADVEKDLQRIMTNDIQFNVPLFKCRRLKETKSGNI